MRSADGLHASSTDGARAGVDPSLVRRLNTQLTLRTLRERGAMTLTQIVGQTRLSRSTIEGILPELLSRQLVVDAPSRARSGRTGRPARSYEFRANAGYLAGVGVGLNRIIAQVVDLAGNVVAGYENPTELDQVDHRPLPLLRKALDACFDQANLPMSLLRAIGVGVPGIINSAGTLVRCDPVPSWEGVALGEQLERTLHCRAFVDSHARYGALGEQWKGVAQDDLNLIFILAGTRTGVGVIVNGQLLRGRNGTAGQIGDYRGSWVRTQDSLDRLEVIAPGMPPEQALRHAFVAAARGGAVAKDAAGGDAVAKDFVDDYIRYLGDAIQYVAVAFDPDLIVIGGDLAPQFEPYLEVLKRHIDGDPQPLTPSRTVLSILGEESIMHGGTRVALEFAERTLLDL